MSGLLLLFVVVAVVWWFLFVFINPACARAVTMADSAQQWGGRRLFGASAEFLAPQVL